MHRCFRLGRISLCIRDREQIADSVSKVIANAADYNVDVDRIGLWEASAGGNLAAAMAVRHVEAQRMRTLPSLSYVSLVVPVTAHPQAFAKFEKTRNIPQSRTELLFAYNGPPPTNIVQEFEALLGK